MNVRLPGLAIFLAVSAVVAGMALAAPPRVPAGAPAVPAGLADSAASVVEHHGDRERTGLYVAPNLTRAAAARLHLDAAWKAPVAGPTYAQPLFVAGTAGRPDLLLVATERNQVTAFDAANARVIWQRTLAPPVPRRQLPCGNIDPLGVTGTPYADLASRTLFLDAMTLDRGSPRHKVYALGLDDGATKKGWPVDANASFHAGKLAFDSSVQNERGALALLHGVLYVPYGGHWGDCGAYHGWVVGIPLADPAHPTAWATEAEEAGIWAPSGIASDGAALYVTTGNGSFGLRGWGQSEMIGRLAPGPRFSGQAADFWAPQNWRELDNSDVDLGGTGPMVIDVPGANPSRLLVAMGKDGKVYLANRDRLGGIGGPVVAAEFVRGPIINAAAAYRTARGTYLTFLGRGAACPGGGSGATHMAVRIAAGAPPRMATAWCADGGGRGSPMVTSTDGRADAIVWLVGAEGDNRLRGFDGDTGAPLVATGAMGPVRRYVTPIFAKGRIYVAGDEQVYAFRTD